MSIHHIIPKKVRDAAEEAATALGAQVSIEPGGKHYKLIVSKKGMKRTTALTAAPRTGVKNQIDWVRQDIRRLVRELDQ